MGSNIADSLDVCRCLRCLLLRQFWGTVAKQSTSLGVKWFGVWDRYLECMCIG
jgi:hypothetical protein